MILSDTSALIAAAGTGETARSRCARALAEHGENIVVPQVFVSEVVRLPRRRFGRRGELLFLRSLADGDHAVEPVADSGWERIAVLVERYADLPLGTVDASIVATAARLGLSTIFTVDSDFEVVRPEHLKSFELLPR